jgi:hypothetical protein
MNPVAAFLTRRIEMRYVGYGVDLSGVARAVYEIDCRTEEDAQVRAEKLLEAHPAIELWDGPRRVARLVREIKPASPQQ